MGVDESLERAQESSANIIKVCLTGVELGREGDKGE